MVVLKVDDVDLMAKISNMSVMLHFYQFIFFVRFEDECMSFYFVNSFGASLPPSLELSPECQVVMCEQDNEPGRGGIHVVAHLEPWPGVGGHLTARGVTDLSDLKRHVTT